jgi:hypothetical protein
MAVLAETIKVYCELPADDWPDVFDLIRDGILRVFETNGLQAPIIERHAGFPARIGDML